MYYSSCTVNPRKRGTIILISKHLPFIFEKEIRDPEGRFILVTGHLFGQHITMLNVYAPNEDSPKFISKIILLFNEHCKGLGICAGDFNCVMDERLDKSSSGTVVNPRSSLVLKKLCKETGLIDSWREMNPLTRDYTFYSNPHCSYSRIDYIFIPNTFFSLISFSKIGSIAISDHAPVQIDITLGTPPTRSKVWKLNSSLLSDPEFCNVVKDSIQNYWSDNKNSPVSPAVMWDAAKATIRGYIISYTAAHKKALISKRQELEKEVKRLERLHNTTPTQTNWSPLCHARAELNLDYTNHIKKLLFLSKQNYYEHGNKSGRLLAYQIKKKQSEKTTSL